MTTTQASAPPPWAPVVAAPLTRAEATRVASALKVLADPTRLRLFSLIASHSAGEVCACELVEPLGISQPTVSHHLKVLTQAGLLQRERRGRWVHYRAQAEQLQSLNFARGDSARD